MVPHYPLQYAPFYYGDPQRNATQPGGQTLGIPAPGGGVYPPGAVNPFTGLPLDPGKGGTGVMPSIPVTEPWWASPPLGAQSLQQIQTSIVNVNSTTGDSDASTAATQLANAYAFNLTGITGSSLIVTPSSIANAAAVLTYNAISNGVFNRLGLNIRSSKGLSALRFQVLVNGANFPGLQEFEPSNFFDASASENIFVPFKANDVVTVNCRNLDLYSAYLVTVQMAGWRAPG